MSQAKEKPKRRKPETVEVGRSRVNRSDLDGLRHAWREKDLVLFLGAGVSKPYGIPTWKDLVLEILFDQTDVARRLGKIDLPFRRALAAWLVDYYEYDPIILARVVKNEIRRRASRRGDPDQAHPLYLEKIREKLYPAKPPCPHEPTALTAVADFIKQSGDDHGVSAVVSFNYDDLLERKLDGGIDFHSVWNARRDEKKGLPILHPHGYLPREGAAEDCEIVFTEDDYHGLTTTVFHWALTAVVNYLRHNTVLFLGLSMLDPNLRRMLDASYLYGDIPAHWQVQRRRKLPASEVRNVLRDVRDRARRFRKEMDWPLAEEIPELQEPIQSILKQADSYDRNLFESMGVKTLWLEDYDDIPALLEAIASD